MKSHLAALLAVCLATAGPGAAQSARTEQTIPTVAALPALEVEGRAASAGASVWFGTIGKGAPVILLHGGLSSSRAWGGQVPALVDAGYRVVLIDTRGHGRSTLGDRPLSYELMAKDVVAVMDRLKLRRASIVGWSDGAITGLVLAMRHRSRVDRVYAFGANMDQQGVRSDAAQAPILNEVGPRLAADYAAMSPTPAGFGLLHQAVRTMQKTEPRYREAELAAIRGVAVTVADGEHDEFITDEHTAYLARVIPARLQILAGAGHFAPWQQTEAFNRALLEFLR
jgi:pimeloyl-ACP methyl ester carboxylesterase